MRRLANISLALSLAASPLLAQTGFTPAPVPGPYMAIPQPQPAMPAVTPQRFAMPMPYWMQNTRQPQAPLVAPSQPAVGRANQQPAAAGWATAPVAQNNSNNATPGFFPNYNSSPQQFMPQPTTNYGAPYPTNNFAPMPWTQNGPPQGGQQYGQQGFMPMPWQNGQNGQNGWGNNWNNNGYRQGYPAPNWPQQ